MGIENKLVGERLDGYYLLQSANPRTSAAGRPYLTVVLADRTGSLEGQVWDYTGPITPANAGSAVKVKGVVTEYRGARQATIETIRLTFRDDVFDPSELVPTAPIDIDAAWEELLGFVSSIEDRDYRAVCEEMIRRWGNRVKLIPAGKSIHHAFRGGLLMHTLNMARAADFLSGLYSGTVDRSLLLAGTILHDFAKCEEFDISPLGVVVDYSLPGQLLGHLTMGAEAVGRAASELGIPREKSVLLRHMILSHHGLPEHGAAVIPYTAESELLAYIDLIDSRMEIYREAFRETPSGSFSKRVFALEKRVYNHLDDSAAEEEEGEEGSRSGKCQ